MSFQAYLDNVEKNAGTIPIRFQEMVRARGCDDPKTRAGVILAWLANDYCWVGSVVPRFRWRRLL